MPVYKIVSVSMDGWVEGRASHGEHGAQGPSLLSGIANESVRIVDSERTGQSWCETHRIRGETQDYEGNALAAMDLSDLSYAGFIRADLQQ